MVQEVEASSESKHSRLARPNWISYVLCEGGFCIQTVTKYDIMYLRYLFYTQLLQETRFLTFVTSSLHFLGYNS